MEDRQQNLKIIISGGGTGGHIFPAIAIANAIRQNNPTAEILFVGAEGRMEMEKVPAAGYPIEGLRISGLQRKLTLANLSFPFKVYKSIRKAGKILRRFNADAVVGVGGYASGPMLYVAARQGVPTLIQEQNSFPGITNKLLAKRVDCICVAYEGMDRFFPKKKILLTGNPVRQDILHTEGKKPRAAEYFQLSDSGRTLLIIGGSLGARTINESIAKDLSLILEQGIQVIWQTGKSFLQRAKELCRGLEGNVHVTDFISKMDYAYALADVVISRAGAIAVSELCLVQKPAILVPSPNVAEDHQTKNAMSMVNRQAALLVKDADAYKELVPQVIRLMQDEARCKSFQQQMKGLGIQDSASQIASEVLRLALKKRSTQKPRS